MKRKKSSNKKPEKISKENLIHIRLEYDEAIQAKRDIISSEMELLRIAKIIRKYHSLRLEELSIKIKLQKLIKMLKSELGKLQTTLPKIKIPGILRKDEGGIEEVKRKIKETEEVRQDGDIDAQLRDIQRKLSAIS
ncbi:hypothetical protein BMS3Abin17_00574 [archaeon BMS3Abin17]|nr:hypothetical protein BMS3Abin17_00574 [archaeon BMS3Abin17]HDZ60617.1 hypothetical protein [Candidatus Pacearchaeota archaeon]